MVLLKQLDKNKLIHSAYTKSFAFGAALISKARLNLSSSLLAKNFGWILSGQIFVKASRLITTLILARLLSIDDYGYVAIILTITQYLMVVSQSGTKDKIIQCEKCELNLIAQTSWNIQFLIGVLSFLIQSCVGFIVGLLMQDPRIALPIVVAGVIHMLEPLSYVQLALIQRRCDFKLYSKINTSVIITDNLASAIFALCGFGYWSIVFKGFVCLPLQMFLAYKGEVWRPRFTLKMNKWKETLTFGIKSLSVDLMTMTRESFDYLMVGRFLGIEALGLYYFAFNSGLGLSMSIAQPLEKSLYSDFCAKLSKGINRKDVLQSASLSAFIMVTIISFQVLLAKLYVPIVFGSKWVDAGALPLIILICLSGMTRLPAKATLLALRSIGKINLELRYSFYFTLTFCILTAVSAQFSVIAVSVSVLMVHFIFDPILMIKSLAKFPRN